MRAQAIVEQIAADARASAQEILADAGERAKALQQASEKRIAAQREETLKRAARDGDEAEQRLVRMAELEERKALLTAKRGVMDKAFALALEKMRKMPVETARAYLLKLLTETAQGGETVTAGSECAWLDEAFIAEANAALKASGKQGALTLAKTRCPGMGFILVRGGMQINCTYDAMLEAARLPLEAEVAKILYA